jgi:hypothetical protein
MLREGAIPRFVHGAIEYLACVLSIVAPFVPGFDAGAAIAISFVASVIVIVVAAPLGAPRAS